MRTKIAALLSESEQVSEGPRGTDCHADISRYRAIIGEMGRTLRQLLDLAVELERERDGFASRLTRGSGSLSGSGKTPTVLDRLERNLSSDASNRDGDWDSAGPPPNL